MLLLEMGKTPKYRLEPNILMVNRTYLSYIELNANREIQCDVELEPNFLIVLEQNISFNIKPNLYHILLIIFHYWTESKLNFCIKCQIKLYSLMSNLIITNNYMLIGVGPIFLEFELIIEFWTFCLSSVRFGILKLGSTSELEPNT